MVMKSAAEISIRSAIVADIEKPLEESGGFLPVAYTKCTRFIGSGQTDSGDFFRGFTIIFTILLLVIDYSIYIFFTK